MNTKEMRNALKSRLSGGSVGPDTAWPNITFDAGTLPRLEVTTAAAYREGGSLKGGQWETEIGRMSVNVCVELNTGENGALDYADAVSALFPEGQRFSYTGGEITIMAPADIREGYPDPDGTCYRVPVIISYRADE